MRFYSAQSCALCRPSRTPRAKKPSFFIDDDQHSKHPQQSKQCCVVILLMSDVSFDVFILITLIVVIVNQVSLDTLRGDK